MIELLFAISLIILIWSVAFEITDKLENIITLKLLKLEEKK